MGLMLYFFSFIGFLGLYFLRSVLRSLKLATMPLGGKNLSIVYCIACFLHAESGGIVSWKGFPYWAFCFYFSLCPLLRQGDNRIKIGTQSDNAGEQRRGGMGVGVFCGGRRSDRGRTKGSHGPHTLGMAACIYSIAPNAVVGERDSLLGVSGQASELNFASRCIPVSGERIWTYKYIYVLKYTVDGLRQSRTESRKGFSRYLIFPIRALFRSKLSITSSTTPPQVARGSGGE